MPTITFSSRLDVVNLILLVVSGLLFLIAAICYIASVLYLWNNPGEPPIMLSLGAMANIAGLSAMAIVPLFFLSVFIEIYLERRRTLKTGNDSDDNTQPGAAGRS